MVAVLRRFFSELRRRKVLGVAIAYAVFAWPIMEVAAFLEGTFELPDWFDRLVVLLLALGFPLTIVLAWVFDITPAGIRRTDDVDDDVRSDDAKRDTSHGAVLAPPLIDSAVASVCVLPFSDISGDGDHDALAEGLAMEIHSALSRMHRLRVVSRRSAFRYRDGDEPVHEIAAALNVRYILSGNVLRSGNRVKVIVELDDAKSGTQIWSERYERDFDDILQIQAEVSDAIVGTFGAERQRDEIVQARSRPTGNLDAWSLVQRARHYILEYNEESLAEAYRLLKESLEVDPDYAAALAALGSVLCERVMNGFSADIDAERVEAGEAVTKAQRLAPHDPFVLKMTGLVMANTGDLDASLRALRGSVDRAPYDFGAWGYFGWPLVARGGDDDLDEAVRIIDRLIEAVPEHPGVGYWLYHKSAATLCRDDIEGAEVLICQALDKHPEVSWAWMHLACIYGAGGDADRAREAAERAAAINPAMTPRHFSDCLAAMSGSGGSAARRISGLREAGMLDR